MGVHFQIRPGVGGTVIAAVDNKGGFRVPQNQPAQPLAQARRMEPLPDLLIDYDGVVIAQPRFANLSV
jgi:hypothetical protein